MKTPLLMTNIKNNLPYVLISLIGLVIFYSLLIIPIAISQEKPLGAGCKYDKDYYGDDGFCDDNPSKCNSKYIKEGALTYCNECSIKHTDPSFAKSQKEYCKIITGGVIISTPQTSGITCTKDKCDKSFQPSDYDQPCWCDSQCKKIGDCCSKDFDYESVCKGGPSYPYPTPPTPVPTPGTNKSYPYPTPPTTVTGITFPTAGFDIGTVDAGTPINYGGYFIYATLGSTNSNNPGNNWAKIAIQDKSGQTVDSMLINQGTRKTSGTTGLDILITDVKAKSDGTIVGVELVIGISVCKA